MADLLVTNGDIWNALVDPIDRSKPGALAELVAKDTPLPASNLLRRSLRLAQNAFVDIDADRVKLVEQYVKTEGDVTTIDAKFHEEFAKLLNVEVTLPGAVAVKVSDLGNITFSGEKLERLIACKFLVDEDIPALKAI